MSIDLPITSIYASVFALILVPITIRIGLYRIKTDTWFLDGGDEELIKRMRSQGNYLEYVPFALLMIALVEIQGAGLQFVHILGSTLLVSRAVHFVTLNTTNVYRTREFSMLGTFSVFIMASAWLLVNT